MSLDSLVACYHHSYGNIQRITLRRAITACKEGELHLDDGEHIRLSNAYLSGYRVNASSNNNSKGLLFYPYGLNSSAIETFNSIAYLSYIPISLASSYSAWEKHQKLLHGIIGGILKSPLYKHVFFIRKNFNLTGFDVCFKLDILKVSPQYEEVIKDGHIERVFSWLAYKLEGYVKPPLVINHDSKKLAFCTSLSADIKVILQPDALPMRMDDIGDAPVAKGKEYYLRNAPYNYHTLLDFISLFIKFKRDTFSQITYGWLSKKSFNEYDLRFADASKFGRWISLSALEGAIANIKLFIRIQGDTPSSVINNAFTAVIDSSKEFNALTDSLSFLSANYDKEKCEAEFRTFCKAFHCYDDAERVREVWGRFLVGMMHNLFTEKKDFFTYMLILRGRVDMNVNVLSRYILPVDLRVFCKQINVLPIEETVSKKLFENLLGAVLLNLKLDRKSTLRDTIMSLNQLDDIKEYKQGNKACMKRFSMLCMYENDDRAFLPYSKYANVLDLTKIDDVVLSDVNPRAIFSHGYNLWLQGGKQAPSYNTDRVLHMGLCEDPLRNVIESINKNISFEPPTAKEIEKVWQLFLADKTYFRRCLLKILRRGISTKSPFVILCRMPELQILLNTSHYKIASLFKYTKEEFVPIKKMYRSYTFLHKKNTNMIYFIRIFPQSAEIFFNKVNETGGNNN